MSALLAAVCIAVAVLLGAPVAAKLGAAQTASLQVVKRDERSVLVRLRFPLCGLAVVAGWAVFGGAVGVVLGFVAGATSWRAISRLESPAAIRRRQDLERDLPLAVHLLGACLAAGAATTTALSSVAESMPGAVGEELALLHRRLHWGVDPASVWRSVVGPLEPLGRSMARAHESGSSVQVAVARLSEDLRQRTRARADTRARTIEVRAAAPLGLCFLPAFVLLGVVPMAAGLFSSLALFR
jgi:Flp pilus assembly protein TadB